MPMSDFNFLNKQQTQQTPVPAPKAVAPDDKQERTCFVNDLSPEEVDKAVEEYSKRIREQLSGETITVSTLRTPSPPTPLQLARFQLRVNIL